MIQTLGWFGSALIVASLVAKQPTRFRLLNLASAVVLLVFNLAIELWSMVALNIVILIVNVWRLTSLWRMTCARNRLSLIVTGNTAAPEAGHPDRSRTPVLTPGRIFELSAPNSPGRAAPAHRPDGDQQVWATES
jgi:hypothetical protein